MTDTSDINGCDSANPETEPADSAENPSKCRTNSARSARDIYIAIMVASANGRGLRLSPDEVDELAGDEAIRAAALNGLSEDDWPERGDFASPNWKTIDPSKSRVAGNLFCKAPEDRTRQEPTP